LKKERKWYVEYDDGKNVLRKSLSPLIPQEIIRRKKQGFSSPDESWYRGENIQYIRSVLLNPRAIYRDFLQPDFVQNIIEEHCEKRINHRLLIWSFLCFEEWCKTFLLSSMPY
jgi:asparagine synthase (glutamine-hydrolysing)